MYCLKYIPNPNFISMRTFVRTRIHIPNLNLPILLTAYPCTKVCLHRSTLFEHIRLYLTSTVSLVPRHTLVPNFVFRLNFVRTTLTTTFIFTHTFNRTYRKSQLTQSYEYLTLYQILSLHALIPKLYIYQNFNRPCTTFRLIRTFVRSHMTYHCTKFQNTSFSL